MNGRFGIVPAGPLADPDLSGSAKAMYAALALFADHLTRECHPSQEQLAQASGLKNARRVRSYVAELRARGWIETKRSQRGMTYVLLSDRRESAYQQSSETGAVPPITQSPGPEACDRRESAYQDEVCDRRESAGQQSSETGAVPPITPDRRKCAGHTDPDRRESAGPTGANAPVPPAPPLEEHTTEQTRGTPLPPDRDDEPADWEINRELVDDWNRQLPATKRGLRDETLDLAAMRRLRLEVGKTPAQIRGYAAYLRRTDKARFCRRPYKLVEASDQGRGPAMWAVLDDDIERDAASSGRTTPSQDQAPSDDWDTVAKRAAAKMKADWAASQAATTEGAPSA